MPSVLRDAHLGSAFDAQLQYCLALLQREAPDGLICLNSARQVGCGKGGVPSDHPIPGIGPRGLISMGGGRERKNQALESLGGDEEGIKDHYPG